ncbi:6-carboxytetrahydropterin synthase [Vibrio brasiliensis]|uniref:6-pyruvoyl trahydropterin synthase family protein n=1 Tax=Vibrio brasiliensis TaxID=170652 RepID=UPI001EFDEAF3|nr:6-carboxytetrahydropterin synthase [Vibrio brasiliensis]
MNLFVKALTVIDASYLCDERGMVGESWILDVSLSGQLNEMSMVLDFGKVKKQIKHLVDQFVDHRLLIPQRNSKVCCSETEQGYLCIDLMREGKSIHLNCPEEAFCFVDARKITVESVTQHVYQLLRGHLPDNVEGLEITLRSENIAGAYYHYSHGLKKHDGNCQRIAHGHRSMLELIVDGQRHPALEKQFALRWEDIYLASREDKVDVNTLTLSKPSSSVTDESHYGFSYVSPQGKFELVIPKCETEIIDTDTTVELLASYIADEIKKTLHGGQSLRVVAYEGVGKGAIACR